MSEEEILENIEHWIFDNDIQYSTVHSLLDLYNKEKEKNVEYEKQLDLDYVDKNYIRKDKIKNKIKEIEEQEENASTYMFTNLLEDILEE